MELDYYIHRFKELYFLLKEQYNNKSNTDITTINIIKSKYYNIVSRLEYHNTTSDITYLPRVWVCGVDTYLPEIQIHFKGNLILENEMKKILTVFDEYDGLASYVLKIFCDGDRETIKIMELESVKTNNEYLFNPDTWINEKSGEVNDED